MKARLIKIGNSQGVRIPRPLIEEAGLEGEVELSVEGNSVIIRAVGRPRQGWHEAFQAMAECGDDALLDGDLSQQTPFDEDEWAWE